MNIGFIGMGIMGLPMAVNLVKKSGHQVYGFDISGEQRDRFADQGGISANSILEVQNNCEVIFLSLPKNELVKETAEGIIESCKSGTTIVDTSSSSPDMIRELYGKAKERGIDFLDSPVSGGEKGAIEATLVLMCGGDASVFDRVKPLLLCMGNTASYLGGCGCGCIAKIANNMIVGCNIAAVGEAFAFAAKAGLQAQALFEAIKDGFAASAVLEAKASKMIAHDFTASARIAVHQKDLKNAAALAEQMDVDIPLSKIVLDYMNEMEQTGRINEDHCAISQIYEARMNTRL